MKCIGVVVNALLLRLANLAVPPDEPGQGLALGALGGNSLLQWNVRKIGPFHWRLRVAHVWILVLRCRWIESQGPRPGVPDRGPVSSEDARGSEPMESVGA